MQPLIECRVAFAPRLLANYRKTVGRAAIFEHPCRKMIPFVQRLIGQMAACNASEPPHAEFSADQAQEETKAGCDRPSLGPAVTAVSRIASGLAALKLEVIWAALAA